jgi:hypothetical protein
MVDDASPVDVIQVASLAGTHETNGLSPDLSPSVPFIWQRTAGRTGPAVVGVGFSVEPSVVRAERPTGKRPRIVDCLRVRAPQLGVRGKTEDTSTIEQGLRETLVSYLELGWPALLEQSRAFQRGYHTRPIGTFHNSARPVGGDELGSS